MQTDPCPVGYHIGSGYKPHRKWFKYELAKTRMYSWACCCGMSGMWNNEMRRHSSRDDNVCSKLFGGKHINAYIFPFANGYASWIDYFDTYTRNLESECKIMIFCKLVYLYICAFYLSWVSCEWATLSSVILYTLVYLSLKWINSVIRIHDKYQSCFLVGLALTCKASSQIRYILLHYRSNWRELRPLMTPWANCIKESIEPCIGQKRFMPSHAQVSHLPLSLSPLLLFSCSVFGFCCSYYYYCYCCCYEYLLVKSSHKSSGYENKPEPEYSNDYECKPGQNLLSFFLFSSFPCC